MERGNHPSFIRKKYLVDFWEKFGNKINNGVGFYYQEKIDELIKLSKVIIITKTNFSLINKRRFYEKKKYNARIFKVNKFCFCCGLSSQHRHHIILLKNNGLNSVNNIAPLCIICHKKIHNWL